VPAHAWPTLDGQSLTPFLAVAGEAEPSALALPGPGGRPDFVVSQFHGWF
jgi:hypothetical protein